MDFLVFFGWDEESIASFDDGNTEIANMPPQFMGNDRLLGRIGE